MEWHVKGVHVTLGATCQQFFATPAMLTVLSQQRKRAFVAMQGTAMIAMPRL
jgi:hypothetical protein